MNALSAGIVAITQNQKKIDLIKTYALELASFYQGQVKMEININKQKSIAQFNITEYNL